MHHPTVVDHWLEREIAQWVHPMKDRSDDPSHHERTLLPRSFYINDDYLIFENVGQIQTTSQDDNRSVVVGLHF